MYCSQYFWAILRNLDHWFCGYRLWKKGCTRRLQVPRSWLYLLGRNSSFGFYVSLCQYPSKQHQAKCRQANCCKYTSFLFHFVHCAVYKMFRVSETTDDLFQRVKYFVELFLAFPCEIKWEPKTPHEFQCVQGVVDCFRGFQPCISVSKLQRMEKRQPKNISKT